MNFNKKISRYYYTVRYLKFIQIYFQVFYRIRRKLGFKVNYSNIDNSYNESTRFDCNFLENPNTFIGNNHFCFLNIEKDFKEKINWNFLEFGKLWNYNLQYLDYINQLNIEEQDINNLIESITFEINNNKILNEPYPVSLRIMNLVKYFSKKDNISNEQIIFLKRQIIFLRNNIEYHILANHILENGFALLMGGLYIGNNKITNEAKKILYKELERQILPDGAHIELSPMYHSIILVRLLDCINLIKGTPNKDSDFIFFLINCASKMLAWLKEIQFNCGQLPCFNDSTEGITFKPIIIFNYSENLGIPIINGELNESGYWKLKNSKFELIVDCGNIQPSYQPGHAHADTGSFFLQIDNKPFITETGTSTYQNDEKRHLERSSIAHNNVVVNNLNSSDVWSTFRVGKRASIIDIVKNKKTLIFSHNGYSNVGVVPTRNISYQNNIITIIDTISANKQNITYSASAYIHFDDSVEIKINGITEIESNLASIKITNASQINLGYYNLSKGFNRTVIAKFIEIKFSNNLTTYITPN